jgi:predicted XRE-type DNA-binding protein
MNEDIVESCGNVFQDLGFPPDEAAVLQIRSELMGDLRKFIEERNMSKSEAAKILGLSQQRAFDLIRGKWDKFSLETLIALATRAGMRISLNRAA